MKQILILCLVGLASIACAQDTIVTIQQIQTVPVDSLINCNDAPNFEDDTVIVHGTVVMAGGLSTLPGGNPGANVWIQSGSGSFSGIELFGDATEPGSISIFDLLPGDSVKVRGQVFEFDHTTEIIPIDIEVLDAGKTVHVTPIDPADLNDDTRTNIPETGEEWEGVYVEFYNVTAGPPLPFSNGTRSSFNVSDAAGNLINISPRFTVMSLPATGGTFVEFAAGTVFDTIRGVVRHSPNGVCQDNGRGYEVYPFQQSDFVVQAGTAPPQIVSSRNPIDPTSSEDVTVSATITDPDGTVASADLYYAVGLSNNNYLQVPMSGSGTTYTGTIPSTAYSDGDFVKYYVCATDNDYLSQCTPNVPGSANPLFFVAKDTGLTIYDIQFTPYSDGISGYVGLDVTVEGIVTASAQANDLGFIYIQQPGVNQWGGIALVEGSLASLERGDLIRVDGVVENYFGLNRLSVTGQPTKISSGNPLPDPIEVNPGDFTNYDFTLTEPYEGMLVKFVNPNGAGVYVVDQNPDAPDDNFAEYRIGVDPFDPLIGCRVQAGRSESNNFSSLSFSYVNDSIWLDADGPINVPICIVTSSDTMESLTGIMYYGFGVNKLLPRNNDDAVSFSGANCKDGIISAITDAWAGSKLSVYPNPVFDQLTIEFDLPHVVEGHIELVDLVGRTVHHSSFKAMSGKSMIETSQLSQGTYFLRVRTASEVIGYEKVILMK